MGLGSISGLSGNALLDNVIDNTGDQYNPAASYSVGAHCIHDNVLYKCNTAIPNGEVWNAAHWTACNIADELESYEACLNSIGLANVGGVLYIAPRTSI